MHIKASRSPSGDLPSHLWGPVRRNVLKRDEFQCQGCGRPQPERPGAPGRLEVHHIIPLYKGGEPYEMSNLVALCPGCHKLEHSRLPPAMWAKLRDELRDQ